MKFYFVYAFLIAMQIWLIALCCNTFIGSFLLSNTRHHHSDFWNYLFFGAIYGGIFSFPVFIILWIVLYLSLRAGYSAPTVFRVLLVMGLLLSFAASILFTNSMGHIKGGVIDSFIFVLAPCSGAVAIIISYRSIKAVCRKRDEINMLLHYADTSTESNTDL